MVSEGEANIELLGLREQQQEERREVQKYRAELSEDDVFIIPAAYPVAINATSNLNFIAFGINAENNQRNFLAGICTIYHHHQIEYTALVCFMAYETFYLEL